MMNPLLAAFLLAALLSSEDPTLADRVRQSWRSGTGGTTAAEAMCNLQAVVMFYDGHHTPELISDELLLWHLGISVGADAPKGLSSASGALVRDLLAGLGKSRSEQWERSKTRARAVVRASTEEERRKIRAEGNRDAWETAAQTRETAAASLRRIRRNLPREDAVILNAWLEKNRRSAVILVRDPAKMIRYDARECEPFLR